MTEKDVIQQKELAPIEVPSKEPGKKQQQRASKKKKEEEELSEEALKKKADIELLVERVKDADEGVAQLAMKTLSEELRGATSSMVSVPLPLKFLRAHFEELERYYDSMLDANNLKKPLADILSVLASTFPNDDRKALHYSLAGTRDGLTSWGHEYLRNISTQIVAEFEYRQEQFLHKTPDETIEQLTEPVMTDLLKAVFDIVPFYMQHRNEVDAVDLLVEVQKIEAIPQYVDERNYKKVTQYMMALASFAVSNDDFLRLLSVVYDIFIRQGECCQAARVALKLRDHPKMMQALEACSDRSTRLQLCYLLALHGCDFPEAEGDLSRIGDDDVVKVLSNEQLTGTFKMLAKELDVEEPKLPEDIYKTHLEDRRRVVALDSAKENLAATFVNAFVNAGFGKDGLMTVEDSSWLYKNKDQGLTAAAASLGAIFLWDIENGLPQLDKYQWSADPLVKAGAYMGFGLVASSLKSDMDPAISLLSDHVESGNATERIGAILGLALAYPGCAREAFLEMFVPLIIDTNTSIEISAFAALALGLSFLGTGNQNAAEALVQTLLERQFIPNNLNGPLAYLFGLALGLLFLGQKMECDATLEALEVIHEHPIGRYASTCVAGLAYAGTGDVTRIQQFLKVCTDESTATPEEGEHKPSGNDQESSGKASCLADMHQAAAVLAMPLVALGEDVGSEMIFRMIDHMLQYGSITMKRAVPLALALSSASNPRPTVVDVLSRLTHEADPDVSLHAIFALGIVGAGTNNSRIAELLRQLASYYAKAANVLFAVRLSQGMLYMGKGLMTLSSLHSDRFLMKPVSIGCLLVVLHSALFMKDTILGRYSYLLYFLVAAMRPRMLVTLDEELHPLPVVVRVGQAVDTTGQAGNPRTITGFQTHTTPVLLLEGDRAELGTSDYVPVSSLPLEGIVILKRASVEDALMGDHGNA